MNGETRLIDTNVLVHAYTIADDRKHQAALGWLNGYGQAKKLLPRSRTCVSFSLW